MSLLKSMFHLVVLTLLAVTSNIAVVTARMVEIVKPNEAQKKAIAERPGVQKLTAEGLKDYTARKKQDEIFSGILISKYYAAKKAAADKNKPFQEQLKKQFMEVTSSLWTPEKINELREAESKDDETDNGLKNRGLNYGEGESLAAILKDLIDDSLIAKYVAAEHTLEYNEKYATEPQTFKDMLGVEFRFINPDELTEDVLQKLDVAAKQFKNDGQKEELVGILKKLLEDSKDKYKRTVMYF